MKVLTHDDRFHADDVFATAVVKMVFGDKITEIIRSRDPELIAASDIVIDVGGVYDPKTMRFDHHQAEGAGVRENGIPYASFGLVWKEWGKDLCGGSEEASGIVDYVLVSAIDAGDNGFRISEHIEDMPNEYVFNALVSAFGATWKEDSNIYTVNFEYLVSVAQNVLEREIIQALAKVDAKEHIFRAYKEGEDKRILVLDDYWPWQAYVNSLPEVIYIVSPSKQGDKWRVNTVQERLFENKKDLPKEWSGLSGQEFASVSGVPDAEFCHRKLFLASAKSKEGAIALAKLAIEQ